MITENKKLVDGNYEITELVVPKGIRYIGDWEEYNLKNYPFPHILNKELTGCGYTEFCIRNDQDIILVSPRKFLLQNKKDQHQDEVFYVNNELELSVDFELNVKDDKASIAKKKKEDKTGKSEIDTVSNLENLKNKIKEYSSEAKKNGKFRKILVTYDSFRHVKDALQDEILDFQIIVDEFQSIFIDAKFKSSTELEFLTHLNGEEREGGIKLQKVCYVSATPMLHKYLKQLNEFKDLPYYQFDWMTENPGRVKKPDLTIKFTNDSLSHEANLIIQNYLKGKFEKRPNPEGGFFESREAVLFFNSVDGICKAIRKNCLTPEQCNVICADTSSNRTSLRESFRAVFKKLDPDHPKKIERGFNPIGTIPLKGEPHKMFTFCTRTVYLGADFYSTCARSFIFSDSNIDCLSVDISLDLEQILGRQRLDENPWKNSATMIIKTTDESKSIVKEHYDNILKKKIEISGKLLKAYDTVDDEVKESLVDKYKTAIDIEHYRKDYISVNRFINEKGTVYYKPVFNNLMYISDMRSFEIQQIDYKDRFSVFSTISGEELGELKKEVEDKIKEFNNLTNTIDRFKLLVKLSETPDITSKDINNFLDLVPTKYRDYYTLLGPSGIRACSYREADMREKWINMSTEKVIPDGVKNEVYMYFSKGNKYSKAKIKSMLKDIYQRYNFDQTAKASDLDVYFIMKSIKLKEEEKWVNGFEILGYR